MLTTITSSHLHRGPGVALAARRGGKGGYQLHGSEYKANATQLDLAAHDQIVRVDPVSACGFCCRHSPLGVPSIGGNPPLNQMQPNHRSGA